MPISNFGPMFINLKDTYCKMSIWSMFLFNSLTLQDVYLRPDFIESTETTRRLFWTSVLIGSAGGHHN